MYRPPQFSFRMRVPQFNYHQDVEARIADPCLSFQNKHFNHIQDHWCETCDRGFPTSDLLVKHKQQHQKCNIDGCQFIAHPKVITKHIQMQHATGLYKRIAIVNNPEEIKKWREERKRKYPTRENIEKKEAERQEKIGRGEKIGLKYQHFDKKNIKDGNAKRQSRFTRENRRQNRHKAQNINHSAALEENKRPKEQKILKINNSKFLKENNDTPISNCSFKLKPFAGIRNIMIEFSEDQTEQNVNNLDILIDDDEDCNLSKDANAVEVEFIQPQVCGALSSLICNYESSEEECMESKKDNNLKMVTDDLVTSNSQGSLQEKGNDSGPEEVKIVKNKDVINVSSVPTETENCNKIKKEHAVRSRKRTNFIRPKPKIPSTLLRKLLHTEIRHERNVVLQCIRHIVKSNFFKN